MYCIYTDREVADADGNWDHVIPLSLGGSNSFCVWSDREYNSFLGTAVDGAIANDFLVQILRQKSDARGHSNRPVEPVWRRSSMEGRPIQVTFPRDPSQPLRVWDARARGYLPEADVAGKTLSSEHHISIDDNLRFLAKVSLGAGYFLVGDRLREWTNCDELRALVGFDRRDENTHVAIRNSKLIVAHRFDPTLKESAEGQMYQAACRRRPGGSLVIMHRHNGYVSFHIGILGEFMGSVFCPASDAARPTSNDDQGDVVELFEGQLTRRSLFEWFQDWHTEMGSSEPTSADGQEQD